MPSLIEWGKIVADTLDTNGVFYMVEFHPICWMFDEKDYRTFTHKYSGGDVITEEVAGSYVDKDDKNSFVEHTWNHGVGDVINALAGAGLHIEYCNEHYQTPYPIFPELIKTSAGLYEQKNGCYPLLFEVKATKR